MRRVLVTTVAALVGLLGSLAATLYLYRSAVGALNRVIEERMSGAGESGSLWLAQVKPSADSLANLMRANGLDGAYLLTRDLAVAADATGPARSRADLLRVDAGRVRRAFDGEASIAIAYVLGEVSMATGYFPVRAPDGRVAFVLALEMGQTLADARKDLERALSTGLALSAGAALVIGFLAASWTRSEGRRRQSAERAARGEAVAGLAAMAAHEIRNPLGVIRGTVELMRDRSAASLSERDRSALDDVLGEVERLRHLTEELLDLAADRRLDFEPIDLRDVLADAAEGAEAAFPSIRVARRLDEPLPVRGDRRRLQQVFANLLANAAEAQASGEVALEGRSEKGQVTAWVEDRGAGIPAEARDRLFELFVTTKADGTGLGLALSKRLVERHGGTLSAAPGQPCGTRFTVRLPRLANG